MAEITIIVPVYKAEKFLHRCVDSILNQSFSDFDLLLVNDGSPDSSGTICDEYAKRDSRVCAIHQENAGCSAARNTGIEYALKQSDSRWIAFVDSDDWLHRDYLKCLWELAEKTSAQMALCESIETSELIEDAQVHLGEIAVMEPEEAFVICYPRLLPPWGKLIEKSLLTEIRFPVGMRYEDAAIMHLLVFAADRIAACQARLYYYYDNGDSFTRTAWTESRLQVVTVHRDRLDYLKEKGYEKAYRRELEEYAERITSNLCSLTDLLEEGNQYRLWFDDLRDKLRVAVQEAESIGAFRLDRERLMTYVYVGRGDTIWHAFRAMQRVWRKIMRR